MNPLKCEYKKFLFAFFGLNAKYRAHESVRQTQYYAIAQAAFFLAALFGVLISTALVFLSEWRVPDSPVIGISWFGGIYAANLILFRCWIGIDEMQHMVSTSTPADLVAAERKAVILLVVTVPTIMFSLIFISWYFRG